MYPVHEIFDQVKEVIVKQLVVYPDEVQMTSTFVDDLGADSLDIVELLMTFEEELNIEIPDEVAEVTKTVKDVVDKIFYIVYGYNVPQNVSVEWRMI